MIQCLCLNVSRIGDSTTTSFKPLNGISGSREMASSTFLPLTRSSFICCLPDPWGTNATPFQCSTSERTRYLSQQRVSSLSTSRKPCDICSLSQEPPTPEALHFKPRRKEGDRKHNTPCTAGWTHCNAARSLCSSTRMCQKAWLTLEIKTHVQHTCLINRKCTCSVFYCFTSSSPCSSTFA